MPTSQFWHKKNTYKKSEEPIQQVFSHVLNLDFSLDQDRGGILRRPVSVENLR